MRAITHEQQEVAKAIRKNLYVLMKRHHLNVSKFCIYIETQKEPSMDRSTFTRFMNGTTDTINVAFLLSCCHVFGISLNNLVSPRFDPDENYKWIQETYGDIAEKNIDLEPRDFDYPVNEIFIENPDSPLMKQYIQTYYCYYFSTVADENKTNKMQESLMFGKLIIEPDGRRCKARLEVNTKMVNEKGMPKYKVYKGYVVLCPSIQSIHCILTLAEGEFCFIIFRYSHLNFSKQECRLAEILSTSSKPDNRYPIVHRMFLSNEEIKKEDLDIIAPHLKLNSTEIFVNEASLQELAEESEDYNLIVQEILKTNPEHMYCIKENTIKDISKGHLTEEELSMFITKLRTYSLAKRYNKISRKADKTIRDALRQRGYFQKQVLVDEN